MTDKPKSKRGGPRPGSGRKPGAPERLAPLKDKAKFAEACREHEDEIIAAALNIMRTSTSDNAKMAAISWLSDRGWGKAPQSLQVDLENPNDIGHLFGGLITAVSAAVNSKTDKS